MLCVEQKKTNRVYMTTSTFVPAYDATRFCYPKNLPLLKYTSLIFFIYAIAISVQQLHFSFHQRSNLRLKTIACVSVVVWLLAFLISSHTEVERPFPHCVPEFVSYYAGPAPEIAYNTCITLALAYYCILYIPDRIHLVKLYSPSTLRTQKRIQLSVNYMRRKTSAILKAIILLLNSIAFCVASVHVVFLCTWSQAIVAYATGFVVATLLVPIGMYILFDNYFITNATTKTTK